MRRRLRAALRTGAIAAAIVLSFVALSVVRLAMEWEDLPAPLSGPGRFEPLMKAWRVRGAIHCHGLASDGSGSIDDIARAAKAAGLGFVVVTDHVRGEHDATPATDRSPILATLGSGAEGRSSPTTVRNGAQEPIPTAGPGTSGPDHAVAVYRNGVLVIRGGELSTSRGHLLYMGVSDAEPLPGDAERAIAAIHARGGLVLAAHPERPSKPWRDAFTALDGTEVVNLGSLLELPRPYRRLSLITAGILSIFRPAQAILSLNRRPDRALELWDRASTPEHPLPALFGTDAHGSFAGPLGPDYVSSFRAGSTHILLDEPMSGEALDDSRLVQEAIASARALLVWDGLGDASGAGFWAELEPQNDARRGEPPATGAQSGAPALEARSASTRIPTPRARPAFKNDGSRPVLPGAVLAASEQWVLKATAPASMGSEAEVRLLRDGRVIATGAGQLRCRADAGGVYRIEIYQRRAGSVTPWIYSNGIGIRSAADGPADRAGVREGNP